MAADRTQQPWSFDVSSLMVLIREGEELNYRLSQRSLVECLALVPVVGLQNYMCTYDSLSEPGSLTYFSPYGVKSAPLRNIQLSNAIKSGKLLEDKKYNVFRIPGNAEYLNRDSIINARRYQLRVYIWVALTWLLFTGVLVFLVLAPNTTWVGKATCGSFTAWSIVLRVVEYLNVGPALAERENVQDPEKPDAIFILGRDNSAFVLEGTREDIKGMTSRGLAYKEYLFHIPSWFWQGFTRLGSLIMLLFIFSAIPNGSTLDQVAFIIINGLAQVNVLIGQRLNGECVLSKLEKVETPEAKTSKAETRTHIYGYLLRRFSEVEKEKKWVDAWGKLPNTSLWNDWRGEVVIQTIRDPKGLYRELAKKAKPQSQPTVGEENAPL